MAQAWTDGELAALERFYPLAGGDWLAGWLPGRTPGAIKQKARELKIRLNADVRQRQLDAYGSDRPACSGKRTFRNRATGVLVQRRR